MPQLSPQQLRQLARLGAEARLAQLDAEIAAIKSVYPDLAGPRGSGRKATQPAAAAKPRKPYRMSPAARKAAAERMRRYWAERKAAKSAGQPQGAAQKKAGPKRKGAGRKRAAK